MATLRTTPIAICIAVVVLAMSELVKSDRRNHRCTPIHCEWSDWASWSNCSTTCGGSGRQFRHRSKLQTATCGGRRCEGDSQLKRSCNRFCYNGGTLQSDTCLCQRQHYGQCCEHHRLSKRGKSTATGTNYFSRGLYCKDRFVSGYKKRVACPSCIVRYTKGEYLICVAPMEGIRKGVCNENREYDNLLQNVDSVTTD